MTQADVLGAEASTLGKQDAGLQAKRPTQGEILRWRTFLTQLHKKRIDMLLEIRDQRAQRKGVNVPESLKYSDMEVRTNLVANTIDRIAGIVQYNSPTVHVDPSDATKDKALEQSSKLERFYNALLPQLEKDADRPVFDLALDSAVEGGWACLKFGYEPGKRSGEHFEKKKDESDADYNERTDTYLKNSGLPFWVRDLDMAATYWYNGPYGVERVQEYARKPLIEMQRLYGAKKRFGAAPSMPGITNEPIVLAQDMGPTVLITEDWVLERGDDNSVTGAWCSVLVNNQLVEQYKMSYWRLPYFFGRGIMSNSRAPDLEGLSVANQMVGMAPQVDVLFTVLLNYAILMPSIVFKRQIGAGSPQPDPTTNEVPPVAFRPGEGIELDPGVEPTAPFAHLAIGRDFYQMGQLMINMMGQSGPASVLSGQIPGAETPGYTLNSAAQWAMTQLKRITVNHERQVSELLTFIACFIEKILNDDVYVYAQNAKNTGMDYMTLKPSDIGGWHQNRVEREPLTPQNEITRGSYGTQQWQEGVYSMRYNREHFHDIANPEEMERQIIKEGLLQSIMMPRLQKQLEKRLDARFANADNADANTAQMVMPDGSPMFPGGVAGVMPPGMPPGGNPALMTPGGTPTLETPTGPNGRMQRVTPTPRRRQGGAVPGQYSPTGNPPMEPGSLPERQPY